MKFSDKLKQCRKEHNLTQAELAELLSVSQSTVGNWESDRREPDIDMIKKIAAALVTPVECFFDDSQEDKQKAPPPDEERWKRNRDKVDGLPDETKERLMEQIEALIDIEVHRGQ